jgi:uncharacterized protein YjbI with pentapeptide repeats
MLAGANLSGAVLPDALKFEELSNVAEASRNAGGIFTLLLGVCGYCWITIGSTTDLSLLTNTGAAKLPLLNNDVPTENFYLVAPLMLLALSLYFYLYLQRLWERLAGLPAVFPDGMPLDQKAYPWLMNGLVRAFRPRVLETPVAHIPLPRGQFWLTSLVAWGAAPLTLLLFWARYLCAHEWWGTALQSLSFVISLCASFGYCGLSRHTLAGEPWDRKYRTKALRRAWIGGLLAAPLILFGAWDMMHRPHMLFTWRTYFADLREADISVKPADWKAHPPAADIAPQAAACTGQAAEAAADMTRVKRALLSHRDLRFLQAPKAFLARADLQRAGLQYAWLDSADLRFAWLQGADFQNASLVGARLAGAQLDGARFLGAKLKGIDLSGAACPRVAWGKPDLSGAVLAGAELRGADLSGARLSEHAVLTGACLEGADLTGATLEDADLSGAHMAGARLQRARLAAAHLGAAHLDQAHLEGADLTAADLRGAVLQNAVLRGTGLRFAQLQGAYLLQADLRGADLRGADLTDAHDVTPEQLAGAMVDASTETPAEPDTAAAR